MATSINMPKLSDTMTEGTLVKWRKQQGDKVETGDIIAEIETDKATMEMEAFDDGILHQLLAEGGKVAIGAKMGLLLGKDEQPPAAGAEPAAAVAGKEPAKAAPAAGAKSDAKPAEPAQKSASASAPAPAAAAPAGNGERIKISPFAKKLAAEKGIDPSTLRGTGPGGRIVAADIESAKAGPATTAAPAAKASAGPQPIAPMPAGAGDQRIALSGMRRVIAERLLLSKSTIPHFYLHIEIDAGPLMKLRAELNGPAADAKKPASPDAPPAPKLTVNDFVLRAVVAAAVAVPAVNASFAGDAIIQYGSVNLAVAVAVDEGLITPVLRDAQKKSLREISDQVKDLATRARGKKLKPEEYQGGTITVSNLGSYGIETFDAIINPPQALIVSVGAIVKKPVIGPGDTIVPGQRMSLGLSADHRVIDGAIGATYLAELRRLLESPALLLL